MRKCVLILLSGFLLSLAFGSPCFADADDIRALEDRAAQRVLGHFVRALQKARNIVVHPNGLLPSDHLVEERGYCQALVDAARNKNGEGITAPVPAMSTGRDGNPAIFEHIRKLTAPCASARTPDQWAWEVDGIPGVLLDEPEYPRLFSVYELKGAEPRTVVLERQFYDDGYNDIHSVYWVNFFPRTDTNMCYAVAGNSGTFPRREPVENYAQGGVLQFAGKIFFYETEFTGRVSYWPSDWSRGWSVTLTAPQMSLEELFSREATTLPYAENTPRWYCNILFN